MVLLAIYFGPRHSPTLIYRRTPIRWPYWAASPTFTNGAPLKAELGLLLFSCPQDTHRVSLYFTLLERRNARRQYLSYLNKQEKATPQNSPLTIARKGCPASLAIFAATPTSALHPTKFQIQLAGSHSCCSSTACLGDRPISIN